MKNEFDIFGKYWFGQEIDTIITVREFDLKEYEIFHNKDVKFLHKDEKLYVGEPYEWVTPNWIPTLGVKDGRVYEILLEHPEENKNQLNAISHVIINLFNREFHDYDKHPFFSKKYMWILPNARIVLDIKTRSGLNVVSVAATCFDIDILRPKFDGLNQNSA